MIIDVNGLKDYKSIPFYSLNDKLDKKEIVKQINHMYKNGMGGFFLHARGGLETEYLSDEWFDIMQVAIDEAEKLDMNVWFYDENGWPSGFADGKLLCDDNYVAYLELKELDYFDGKSDVVFIKKGGKFIRIFNSCKEEKYYCIYIKYNETYVDILNPKITKKFIESTHEVYYKKFSKYFGNTVKGFFTDEPQYFRNAVPWTNMLFIEFEKEYGYDVLNNLISLFYENENSYEFRYHYWKLMNRLFVENYQKIVYNWCEEKNCLITGHTIEEITLYGQMQCCAGVMPYYEYLHIPGIDWLTRMVYHEISPKQLSSVCCQLDKKQCITETFGASGHSSSPRDFKQIAEFQYVAGVNLMCQHLYPYSVRGLRKRDYPPFFSCHTKWNEISKEFNDYFTRLGYIISNNVEKVDTLMMHPLFSAYEVFDRNHPETLGAIEVSYHELMNELVKHHIPHHFGDETIMEKYAKVEGDTLLVGSQTYHQIVLPKLINISKNTMRLLKEFVFGGGKLILTDGFPEYIDGIKNFETLNSTYSLKELYEKNSIQVESEDEKYFRSMKTGDYFYIISTNNERTLEANVALFGVSSIKEYDLINDKYYKVNFEKNEYGIKFTTKIEAYGSKMYVINQGEEELEEVKTKEYLDITKDFKLKGSYENYYPIDYAYISKDGVNYSEKMPICKVFDRLLFERFSGKIYLKSFFDLANFTDKLKLILEKNNSAVLTINGEMAKKTNEIILSKDYDVYDLSKVIKNGENEIILEIEFLQSEYIYHVLFDEGVTESLKNKLTLKTELETMFLVGNFNVFSKSDVSNRENFNKYSGDIFIDNLKELTLSNLSGNGYPFLNNIMEIDTNINIEDTNLSLKVDFDLDAVSIYINDEKVKDLVIENKVDISKYLVKGENKISLKLYPSSQNFYGAHHFKEPETIASTPYHFGYNNFYVQDDPNWCDDYFVKKQGISKILLLKNI